MAQTRVVVLGAGLGGFTAANHLSSSPELRDRFEVTVYQCGWRVGGKGASGRNCHSHQRIEEHGLHVWFGFYDNAFRLMQDCYGALGRPSGSPLDSWRAAFEPCSSFVLYEAKGRGWDPWVINIPENRNRPGEPRPFRYWHVVAVVIRWFRAGWVRLLDEVPGLMGRSCGRILQELAASALARAENLAAPAFSIVGGPIDDGLVQAERVVRRWAAGVDASLVGRQFTSALRELKDLAWLVGRPLMEHPTLRRYLFLFDLAVTTMHGISHDRLEEGTYGADELDLRVWLDRHGAKAETLESGPVRALYDLVFAFEEGDVTRPNLAAGKAVAALVRIAFDYKGAITWKMQAGMGDVVFTPLYQLLRHRGVRFQFFHWATQLRASSDGQAVDRIELIRQVDLAGGAISYDPLVNVKGLGCWPSEPKWELLAGGPELAARPQPPAFEHEANPLGRADGAVTLRRGSEFEVVVLAIPVGALPALCPELVAANEDFAAMVDGAVTVSTQAFQLWFNKPLPELGWGFAADSIAGAYDDPVDTYCNMSHLLEREDWAPDEACSVAYFCGVYPDRAETQVQANGRAKGTALDYMDTRMGPLWPAAVTQDGIGHIQWDLLVDDSGASGRSRFDAQYWRANTSPWERYVRTPAGSTKTRLRSDESGFENVFLAGDWTRNGIDGGCLEAAVISGMQAARAISGDPLAIANEDSWLQGASASIREVEMATAPPAMVGRWADAAVGAGAGLAGAALRPPVRLVQGLRQLLFSGRPPGVPAAPTPVPYVDFGGLTNFPGPYRCQGTKLWVWFPRVDQKKVAELCTRALSRPTGGAWHYRPVWPRVMLTFGEIAEVIPEPVPFDSYGSLTERQVALWVPTIATRDVPGPFDEAAGVAMFVPYIWLDNGMSFATGREGVGWPKTSGWPQFPGDDGLASFRLDVFGLKKFGAHQHPDRYPLLEVNPPAAAQEAGPEWVAGAIQGLDDVVEALRGLAGDKPLFPLGLGRNLLESVLHRRLRQVFLKQVRGAGDGRQAALQQIVEAAARVIKIDRVSRLPAAELVIHQVESQPVTRELGLDSQDLDFGLLIEMDFVQETGTVVWDAYGHRI